MNLFHLRGRGIRKNMSAAGWVVGMADIQGEVKRDKTRARAAGSASVLKVDSYRS
jgi:hypothetical protein